MPEISSRPRIATLPQSVADRIAAGEVVERPAAVVKELIENALDASASRITVVIVDAGRTLMRVIDDGVGMTGSDLASAIGRHATSKLKKFEDLEELTTFGFRGEALPSMAAVSRLDVVSRARGEEIGARLTVAGGVVEGIVPVACPEGTSVTVGHLFYNVPARRKFLRSDATEFKAIVQVFKHFALAFPEVGWDMFRGEEPLYQLPAGEHRKRLAGLFGDDVAEELIEIKPGSGWLKVSGWISPPHLFQRTAADQYLFINRRPIASPRLGRAVYNGAEPFNTSGGHPLFVVLMESPPDRFDINVHPAKKEVKFADESGAFGSVFSAVRASVGAALQPPDEASRSMTESTETGTQRESIAPSRLFSGASQRSPIDAPPHLTPYVPLPRRHLAPRGPLMPFPTDTESAKTHSSPAVPLFDLHDDTHSEASKHLDELDAPTRPTAENLPRESDSGPPVWQVFDTYIVSPLKTGLVFIDQHVAHERVLYERALSAMEKTPWVSQQLLFPTSVQVAPEDVSLVEELTPLFLAMGFGVEPFGPREFRIRSVPAAVRISGERQMLLGMIDEMREGASSGADPRLRLAAAFACRGAIKAGQPLDKAEMIRLIEELFQTEDPEFCPHGRPIYHVLNRRDIEKWFKR
jgi:DNA mismatch repair protein MutL